MSFKNSILPAFARTQTYTGISDKFVKVGLSQHNAPELYDLARAQGCHVSRISHLRQGLHAECIRRPDCADGRLPFDDARALAIAGPIDDLGDADVLLRNALAAGVITQRWGHLYMPGFKEMYPIPHAHARAKQARAKRDRLQLLAKACEYQKKYAAGCKAKRAEMLASERMPSAAPAKPLGLVAGLESPRAKEAVHLSMSSKRPPNGQSTDGIKSGVETLKTAQTPDLMSGAVGASIQAISSQFDLRLISAPLTEPSYGGLGAHSSKSQRLDSSSSPGQRSDAGLGDSSQTPTAPLAANEPLTLKPGKKLPLGGPSTTLSANTVVATEKGAPSAESVPTQVRTRQNRRMEPPDDLDEGYFASLEQSDEPNHGLLGGAAKAQRPQAIVEHPSSRPPRTPQPPVAALNEPQARPRATAASGRPPRAPWQTVMPVEAASVHRVVSASTPPSQVRHTTPSPAASDAENDASCRESLETAEMVAHQIDDEEAGERKTQLDKMMAALRDHTKWHRG